MMIVVGIDLGSVAAKGVLLNGDKFYKTVLPTGWSPRDAGRELLNELLRQSGLERPRVDRIVVTGYGRVAFEEADRKVTEISCHARGVAYLLNGVRTIVDIGGQDSKVIRIDEHGKVLDFAMNDKCAAGTGRFLQVMATTLGTDVSRLGELEVPGEHVTVNSMCTVFAESEIIGLLARGMPTGGIIAGLHQSVGKRVASMARRLGIKEKVAFTGGVALNKGVERTLVEELDCPVVTLEDCQFTGALGAALAVFKF